MSKLWYSIYLALSILPLISNYVHGQMSPLEGMLSTLMRGEYHHCLVVVNIDLRLEYVPVLSLTLDQDWSIMQKGRQIAECAVVVAHIQDTEALTSTTSTLLERILSIPIDTHIQRVMFSVPNCNFTFYKGSFPTQMHLSYICPINNNKLQIVSPRKLNARFPQLEPIVSGIWNGSHFITPGSSIPELIKKKAKLSQVNFQGKLLKSVTFHYPPFTIINRDGAWKGIEVNVVRLLSSIINARVSFHAPLDGGLWGSIAANGSGDGLHGELVRDDSDIGTANMFILLSRRKHLSFTKPYYIARSCFMLKSPSELPRIIAIVKPFTSSVWLATAIMLLGVLCTYLLFHMTQSYKLERKIRFSGYVFYIIASCTGESSKLTNVFKPDIIRLFTGIYLLVIFLLLSGYSGALKSFLSVPLRESPITTLRGIVENGITTTTPWKPTIMFETDVGMGTNPYIQKMEKTHLLIQDEDEALKGVKNGSLAMYAVDTYLRYTMKTKLTTKSHTTLAVLSACPQFFYVAMLLPKWSPLKPVLDAAVQHIIEAGLLDRIYEQELESEEAENQLTGSSRPLDLESINGVFIAMFSILVPAIFVFVAEYCFRKKTYKQNESLILRNVRVG